MSTWIFRDNSIENGSLIAACYLCRCQCCQHEPISTSFHFDAESRATQELSRGRSGLVCPWPSSHSHIYIYIYEAILLWKSLWWPSSRYQVNLLTTMMSHWLFESCSADDVAALVFVYVCRLLSNAPLKTDDSHCKNKEYLFDNIQGRCILQLSSISII